MPVTAPIITQHAEEAAFLWILRASAVHAPHYTLKDLAHLDDRVEAHLDGLRVAEDTGWEICADQLKTAEPGEAFAAGVLALEGRDRQRIKQVMDAVEAEEEMVPGLISAFGWVNPLWLKGLVSDLLKSGSSFYKRLGIAACALHRVNPGAGLDKAICDADPLLQARALRAVGEIGRQNLLQGVLAQIDSPDPACHFWAIWSAVRLGERGIILDKLRTATIGNSPFQVSALQLFLRVADEETSLAFLKGVAGDASLQRVATIGMGISGYPYSIPWLVRQMSVPEISRVAGEAFSMITGVDLAYQDLDGNRPEGYESGPTDRPEDVEVDLEVDGNLPWPEQEKVNKWWDENQSRFETNTRYLLGKPITAENCTEVLKTGFQRQRFAAALELAILNPGVPLFETRQRGKQQQ